MEGKQPSAQAASTTVPRDSRRARRMLAAALGVIAASATLAGAASAHTWSLEQDFSASPDGVTAAANPFGDSYGNSGVWAAGYGGGGSYTNTGAETTYSGLTSFSVAPSSDWRLIPFGAGVEGWRAGDSEVGFPIIANNSASTPAELWPAETVILHPNEDLAEAPPRAAVRWVSPVTGTVSIEATFNDVDCGGGDGIDYSVDRQEAGSSTIGNIVGKAVGYCGSGTYTGTELSVKAGDTFYFSVGDGGNDERSFDSTGVGVRISDGAAEPLSVSAPARASGIYNHAIAPLTVSGGDTDGDPVTLSASNVPAGLTFNASTGTLSGSPKVAAGEYVVTFAASDGKGETRTTRTRLTVEKATCAIANKAALFSAKTPVTLKVKVTDPVTRTAVAGQSIGFPVANTRAGEGVGIWFGTTGSTGVAKAKAPLGAGEVYLAGAYLEGSADYQSCSTKAAEIVTIAPASYVSSGAGTITTASKETASFGYIALNEAAGGNPIELVTPAGELRGGGITSLSKPSTTTATWTGAGGWNGENAEYTATANDPSTGADTLSITVTVNGETRWTSGGPITVKGGDVKVH